MLDQTSAVAGTRANSITQSPYRLPLDRHPKARVSPAIAPLRSEILEPPSLAATLDKRASRFPAASKAFSPVHKGKETTWDSRFNVTFSKDNVKYPRPLREYFDRPLEFSLEAKDFTSIKQPSLSPLKSRVSTSHSNRERRSTSINSWVLRGSSHDYMWRTASPVAVQLNQQAHPYMRSYFGSTVR